MVSKKTNNQWVTWRPPKKSICRGTPRRSMSYYLAILGTRDNPLYELEFASFKPGTAAVGRPHFSPSVREILPFIVHAALDNVEDATWSTNQYSLGRVDLFHGIGISAFVTQGSIKFLLCSDAGALGPAAGGGPTKSDDNAIKQFFMEVNELYVKCVLNPLYAVNDPIELPDFDLKVKMLARKYL